MALSEEDQQRLRSKMRDVMLRSHYIAGLGLEIERWEPDGVRIRMPFAERFTNDGAIYHGGAVASLIDTTGASAVWAGHDFDRGMRAATVSMTVNYVGAGSGSDLVADARCIKRGRELSFSEIHVADPDGKPVASASLVYRIVP